MAQVDQETLERWLRRWQPILHVADWNISIRLKRQQSMSIDDAMGSCETTLTKKIARIEILDPIDYGPDSLDDDTERTVVHEILHCLFAPFEPKEWSSHEGIAREQAIHAISTALVTLDRARKS